MALRRKKTITNPGTQTTSDTTERRRPGRPPIHDEAWTKVTVVLFDRQITFLDTLAGNIREKSGATISRAQLIRALVDAVGAADLDLTASTSERDLKATVLARLGRDRVSS
jgi:hypothetical protein